ncbi:hypothetical protein TI39_contig4141g00010 [Zymoseptoria brevis]|uniref:Uncharacterized protein n=1 Tax=Zymoseptoria brevis TaxID=1047168 RepID=A0A0F4GDG6_9PEZI|nr:hypothetical protein TI39_contig4141g00010 [Zymoseptoria brevis]
MSSTLTQTRTQTSRPLPRVRISKDKICDADNGKPLFTIARQAGNVPSFLSSKPLLSVTRILDGASTGTIRFHSVTTKAIDVSTNGSSTEIAHSGFLHHRWGFKSTTSNRGDEMWYWKKDKIGRGAILENAKNDGQVLARVQGDLLTFETSRLGNASYEEVLVSAIAMAEAVRRQKKSARSASMVDLGGAIGSFADSGGGGGGGGGDGGGGGGSC